MFEKSDNLVSEEKHWEGETVTEKAKTDIDALKQTIGAIGDVDLSGLGDKEMAAIGKLTEGSLVVLKTLLEKTNPTEEKASEKTWSDLSLEDQLSALENGISDRNWGSWIGVVRNLFSRDAGSLYEEGGRSIIELEEDIGDEKLKELGTLKEICTDAFDEVENFTNDDSGEMDSDSETKLNHALARILFFTPLHNAMTKEMEKENLDVPESIINHLNSMLKGRVEGNQEISLKITSYDGDRLNLSSKMVQRLKN